MKKQINFFENILYGMCIGIFEVVPGISGGTLAFIFGIYETLINAVSNLKKDFKNSFKILFPNVLGMGIGVYCFSFILNFLNMKFPLQVSFCLTGLILGIIPSISSSAFMLLKKNNNINNKNKLICFISFMITIIIMFIINYLSLTLNSSSNIVVDMTFLKSIKFFVVGMLASFCLMLPGCSGSLIMLVFGIYNSVINAIHNLNLLVLLPVGLGILFGLLIGSKIIAFCLKKFKEATFFAIFGLIIGSIVSPLLNFYKTYGLNLNYILSNIFFSTLSLIFGFFVSFLFSNNVEKK